MGWNGAIIGGCIGSWIGKLPGIIVGGIIGHFVEESGKKARTARKTPDGGSFYRERFCSGSEERRNSARDDVADAYGQLGVPPSASDDDVKKAYRDFAKRYHPDTLKAQGLPDEMVARANEKMSKVNAAWSIIRKERGL